MINMKAQFYNQPMRLLTICALGLTLVTMPAAKDKEFVMPRAFHANTYPAHDAHTDEKFSVAADPYDMPDKQNSAFSTDYKERGVMPVLMVLSNDGDDPVNVSDMKVVIVTKQRTK